MTIFNVFFPILISILYFLLILLIPSLSLISGELISIFLFHEKVTNNTKSRFLGFNKNQINKVLMAIFFVIYMFLFVIIYDFFSSDYIKSKPSANYKQEMKDAKSVIVFGFGLGKDKNGDIVPGEANVKLNDWIKENISKKYIVAQYGNILAQKLDSSNNSFILIHENNPQKYVNSYQAAEYALLKIDSLYSLGLISNNIVLVAHDMQMQRVLWIFQKLAENNSKWQKYNFIVPKIPKIPFYCSSSQLHTKSRFVYNCVELFISRPRDFSKK